MVEIEKSSSHKTHSRIIDSKYGFLEILRAGYSRSDAVRLMRLLCKQTKKLSKDAYLENFSVYEGNLYLEVRNETDLEYFQKFKKKTSILYGGGSLTLDFFFKLEKK